jgi:hypothetical protein
MSSSVATITPTTGGSPPRAVKSKTAAYAASSSVLEDAIASAALHVPQQQAASASSSRSNSASSNGAERMVDRRPPHDATPVSSVERPLRLPSLGALGLLGKAQGGDQTLELLMTHLSAKGRGQFYPPAPPAGSLDDEIDGIEGGKVMSCVVVSPRSAARLQRARLNLHPLLFSIVQGRLRSCRPLPGLADDARLLRLLAMRLLG